MTFNTFLKEFAEGLRDLEKSPQRYQYYESDFERHLRMAKADLYSELAYLIERVLKKDESNP